MSTPPLPHVIHVPNDLNDIFPDFLENRRKEIAAIPELLDRGDFKQIRQWGHNMAGCGEGYGFPAITEFGRVLEAAAIKMDAPAIRECTATLSTLVNNVEIVYC
jgi:hypothetical protein